MSLENRKYYRDSFIVANKKGIHARPSTELARLASVFKSDVTIYCQTLKVNAKCLVGVLMLAMNFGDEVTIEAVGEDAEEAVRSIIQLANNNFYITC